MVWGGGIPSPELQIENTLYGAPLQPGAQYRNPPSPPQSPALFEEEQLQLLCFKRHLLASGRLSPELIQWSQEVREKVEKEGKEMQKSHPVFHALLIPLGKCSCKFPLVLVLLCPALFCSRFSCD